MNSEPEKKPHSRPILSTRILVVDDFQDQAQMAENVLKAHGFEVTLAYDGVEGLASARETLPDLVLLNVMMPRMCGYEVLQKLRADPRTRKIKVIITSSSPNAGLDAKKLGAEDFLPLPFVVSALLDTVTGVLASNKPLMDELRNSALTPEEEAKEQELDKAMMQARHAHYNARQP